MYADDVLGADWGRAAGYVGCGGGICVKLGADSGAELQVMLDVVEAYVSSWEQTLGQSCRLCWMWWRHMCQVGSRLWGRAAGYVGCGGGICVKLGADWGRAAGYVGCGGGICVKLGADSGAELQVMLDVVEAYVSSWEQTLGQSCRLCWMWWRHMCQVGSRLWSRAAGYVGCGGGICVKLEDKFNCRKSKVKR